jgi:hypothetical protein
MNNLKPILIIFIFLLINKNSISQPHTEWVQRYNSSGNYDDYVTDMAIDKSGNVYLTGYISVTSTNQDFVTIKYNTQGVEQWVRYYDGQDHREDKPVAIAVDDSGNVVVSGSSYSSNSSYDYLTIKYNSLGDTNWVRRYNAGLTVSAMDLDKEGNAYVTGIAFGFSSEDILTVKYDGEGNLIWVRTYNGSANGYDVPLKLYVDNKSNVYIPGQIQVLRSQISSGIVIKYDKDGNQKWVTSSPSVFVNFSAASDDYGFVYSIGHSENNNNTDVSVLKFDSIGVLNWQRNYNRSDSVPDQDDFYRDFRLDLQSNSIFTCVNSDNVLTFDIATVKYNSNGDLLWAKIFGVSSSNDESKSITSDKFGNIYVCGFMDNGLFPNYVTLKYNSSGNLEWFVTYNNNNPFSSHFASKVLADTSGNIYVTGKSQGIGSGTDIATIKYSTITKINNEVNIISDKYTLFQNYPNPFNSQTTISYNIPVKSLVILKIFDVLGKEISILVNDLKAPGNYKVNFDANKISSGIYFYSLITNGIIVDTKKLILLK